MLIWQLVLIQIVTFALIILFLRWLLYSHISRVLRRLQKLNQENLEKKKTLKEELERAQREAERKIEEGRQEAENIRLQAKEEAEKNREDMFDKARKEARRMITEAAKDCQRKEGEVTLEMQEKAVYLATDMIKYIFTEGVREDLHIQLIDELIAEIKGLEKEKVKTKEDKAEVVCAHTLKNGQKRNLREALSSKLNRNITLNERIDKEIIAGLVIKLGRFMIDGSVRSKLKKILPMMKEKAKEMQNG